MGIHHLHYKALEPRTTHRHTQTHAPWTCSGKASVIHVPANTPEHARLSRCPGSARTRQGVRGCAGLWQPGRRLGRWVTSDWQCSSSCDFTWEPHGKADVSIHKTKQARLLKRRPFCGLHFRRSLLSACGRQTLKVYPDIAASCCPHPSGCPPWGVGRACELLLTNGIWQRGQDG